MRVTLVCPVLLAALTAVVALPYPQQQGVALPPHLLRQYLADQQQRQRQEPTPIYEQEQQNSAQQAYIQQARPAALKPQPQQQYVQQYVPQPQYAPQPQPQAQVYRPKPQARPRPQDLKEIEDERPEDYDHNPSYQFGFDVNDDQFTNYQNRKEERQGDVIKGSYSVVDSDGFIRTVTYTADPKEGFKAEVVRMPTDIVVKVPTPSPLEPAKGLRQQQAAQYLEAAQPIPQRQQVQQHQAQPQPQQYYRYQ